MATEQEIIATDSFGHSKSIIIIVEPREYTIQFELNGGTGTVDNWAVYEAETNMLPFLPSDCEPPYGKELAGWAIGSLDSDIVIAPGEEYEFTGHTTIYAIWKNATYTIDYELDGGTNAAGNPATFDKDTNTITLLDPFKEGYIFLGWTWEAGMGIGEGAQTEPVKGVTIEIGSVNDKCFVANWARMAAVIDETLDTLPETDKVTTEDKETVEEALEIIDKLLSDENVGILTDEEKDIVEEQKAKLEEMLENIEKAEERMDKVDETLNNLPEADEVTSEDKESIEEALETIDELLADENKGNLTEDQQNAIEEQKAELEEMLENIEKAEERMDKVEDTVTSLPEAEDGSGECRE
jgi:tetratricopeptide (TPR) repeat protein